MKILQLVQSFLPRIGGVEVGVHNLSNELVRRGHDVIVLAAAMPERASGGLGLPGFEPRYQIAEYPFGQRFGEILGRNYRAILDALKRLRRDFGFDVVHARQLYYPGYCALQGRRRWTYPLAITEHGDFYMMAQGFSPRPSRRIWARILGTIRTAPCLTAPGSEVFDLLMRHRAAPPGLSRRLPNGVCVPAPSQIDRLRSTLRSSTPLVLMVGRNHPIKAFDLGLQAMAMLQARLPRARMTIIGTGSERLAPQVRRLGLTGAVELAPPCAGEAFWRHYAAATMLWMPSRAENMPLSKYEAMCFGLPGVYNDAQGVREDIHNEVNGLLFRSNDAEDLARQAERLIDDAALRDRIAGAARATGDHFRWERLVEVYERFYEELIAQSR